MRNVFTVILFLSFTIGFGQDTTSPKEDTKTDYNQIYTSVDTHAIPPGGMNGFRKFIGQSFRLPEVNTTIIGSVTSRFTVCNDGSICDIQILKESPAGIGLGEEVKRTLNMSGNWKPAIKNNESVSSYYSLPINIQITAADLPKPVDNKNNSTPNKE